MPGRLILVPTPLGNLGDITFRATEALSACDLVACEDTRRARTLLKHLGIDKPLLRFDDHAGERDADSLARLLASGKTICYCSDAGMPGINDPGFELVRLGNALGTDVTVLPGPSIVTLAVVASGLSCHAFSFLGYLPAKQKARRAFLQNLAGRVETAIVFETPHRIEKALSDMAMIMPGKELALGRELTKLHETWYRGCPENVLAQLGQERRGEFVMVIAGTAWNAREAVSEAWNAREAVSEVWNAREAVSEVWNAHEAVGVMRLGASLADARRVITDIDSGKGETALDAPGAPDALPDWAIRFLGAAREGGMTLREAVKPLARHLGITPSELYNCVSKAEL